MKITPHKGEGKREVEMMQKKMPKRRKVKMRAQVHATAQRPPSPAQETPPRLEEIIKCIAEAEWLEEVRRLPQSLLTQQLDQMAADPRPSMLDGEEPARKQLLY